MVEVIGSTNDSDAGSTHDENCVGGCEPRVVQTLNDRLGSQHDTYAAAALSYNTADEEFHSAAESAGYASTTSSLSFRSAPSRDVAAAEVGGRTALLEEELRRAHHENSLLRQATNAATSLGHGAASLLLGKPAA